MEVRTAHIVPKNAPVRLLRTQAKQRVEPPTVPIAEPFYIALRWVARRFPHSDYAPEETFSPEVC